MTVYDSQGNSIGSVSYVYLGASTPNEREHGEGPAAEDIAPDPDDNSFTKALINAFDSEEVPHELAQRLRQNGYIRIDSNGLFTSDRFATSEQIASVSQDEVHLGTNFDQLVKPE